MKKIFIILFLVLSFNSCKDEEIKSKTCTYNDQPVDCATMEQTPGSNTNNSASLTATVEAVIEIDTEANTFEIIQGGNNMAQDGNNTCELTINPVRAVYELSEDQTAVRFTLEDQDTKSNEYIRTSFGNGIYGSWKIESVESGSRFTEVMQLNNDGTARFSLICQF